MYKPVFILSRGWRRGEWCILNSLSSQSELARLQQAGRRLTLENKSHFDKLNMTRFKDAALPNRGDFDFEVRERLVLSGKIQFPLFLRIKQFTMGNVVSFLQ
jgi:hypothetical protein